MTPDVQTVKPDHILHELSELWTSLSKQDSRVDAQEGSGVLRACAMTLIVFVDDEADSMELGETLARLMRAHPSRAIVVRLREDTGMLESRVFAQCWMPFGQRRQICCEQIEFSVSLDRVVDIPSIVVAADGCRTCRAWCGSGRPESRACRTSADLLALGDKMIVDSARPGAPTFADLRVLANAGYIVGDLVWTRLTKLRQLLAQLLNGRDLSGIGKVSIEYSGNEAAPGRNTCRRGLRSELKSAAVDLRRVDSGVEAKLKAIRIDPDIHVRIEANCAEYETGSLHQWANLPECSESDLLSEELNIMTHDRIFERALQRMTVWTPRS